MQPRLGITALDYSLSTRVELWTKAEEDERVQMERKHMMMGKEKLGKSVWSTVTTLTPPVNQKTNG